jgi:hypothetical protein
MTFRILLEFIDGFSSTYGSLLLITGGPWPCGCRFSNFSYGGGGGCNP